jgi:hypothetical protein
MAVPRIELGGRPYERQPNAHIVTASIFVQLNKTSDHILLSSSVWITRYFFPLPAVHLSGLDAYDILVIDRSIPSHITDLDVFLIGIFHVQITMFRLDCLQLSYQF